jgi:uncharacterized membrane protein
MYWITGILGLALVAAPYVLGYSDNTTAMWTSVILGLVVVLVSIIEGVVRDPSKWEYWVAGIAGLLALIAPFALGFSSLATAMWFTVVVGALLLILDGYEIFFVKEEQQKQ